MDFGANNAFLRRMLSHRPYDARDLRELPTGGLLYSDLGYNLLGQLTSQYDNDSFGNFYQSRTMVYNAKGQ